MKSSVKNIAIGVLIGAHLLCVLAGATHLRVPYAGRFTRAVGYYLGFSGAIYSWGFFAPNMGSQFKTDFVIHRKDGAISRERMGAHGPNEVLLREAGIASTFWFGMTNRKIRRSLTASWASDAFNRHPDAQQVDVQVSAFYLPSQQQLREGVPSKWVPMYAASYQR
jgi:hypothetical protein